jgi:RNA polymerase sigma factor (TIGR02999 family)
MEPAGRQRAITEVLGQLRAGVPGAMERLVPLVYHDLSRIARRQLRLERAGHTLSTSALVHEAYLRLVDQTRAQWADRGQFFAVAAQVMRRVLVDHARGHRAARRGGSAPRPVSLDALEGADAASLAVEERADILVAIDEALARLAGLDARQARVVECRFFGGLTEAETAEALGVTTRTVSRDWVKARGWLYQELAGDAGP